MRFGEYGSLAANKDKILAIDQLGTLYLLKARATEYELLDNRKLGTGETRAHLAQCGGEVMMRDLTGLTVWRWSK